MVSTHVVIINAVQDNERWQAGEPFALWQLRDLTHLSTSSVVRTISKLVSLKLVKHSKKPVFEHRNYRITAQWRSASEVIEAYEFAKIIERSARGEGQ